MTPVNAALRHSIHNYTIIINPSPQLHGMVHAVVRNEATWKAKLPYGFSITIQFLVKN